ncbi:asparaginyl-tRNA synthetase [Lecanosticta acicola]|uniref:asparagine--tRNA ligase n=1 Tax=Lecanosticta acicola TaxID=111012 RepID=A0AAI8YX45_9PEZI|nr:asparaginyl-tRNA synthetase [Lecanosticta acicola]
MRAWRPASCGIRTASLTPRRPFSITSTRPAGPKVNNAAELLARDEPADRVAVQGWVRSVRKQKRIAFAALGDGSTINSLQAVLRPEDAAGLSHGTAVKLEGEWKASQGAKQSYELQTSSVSIHGENDAESNPLQPKYQTPEFLRTIPHLRPRIPANALLLRLRSQVISTLTRFFNEEGFVQTHTPIITSSDCEGAGEVFTISSNDSKTSDQEPASENQVQVEHFFRSPKYLTVSAQLHLEALAQAVEKVWTLSPTFRAEKSDTSRHLSEFYMLEAEQCFIDDMESVMDLVERMLRAVAIDLKSSKVGKELIQMRCASEPAGGEHLEPSISADDLRTRWKGLAEETWRRITYEEAIKALQHGGFEVSLEDGLSAEHERFLASQSPNKTPIFVTDYPKNQKPFYMPQSTATPNTKGTSETAACFDLLVPDLCELVGGSMREYRSKELLEAMKSKGVAGDSLDWYQDLRKYGSVPHGGFGLGFDRLLCYLSGVGSIRDIVAFPRWYGRCEC